MAKSAELEKLTGLASRFGAFDAVIAPYHDVGMTAIKVASFGSAVNVTLGLPFPRTSPDHGTALDIAGTGFASPASDINKSWGSGWGVRLLDRLVAEHYE